MSAQQTVKIPMVTLPLDKLIPLLLSDHEYVEIDNELAELLFIISKNEICCYVQFPGDQDVDIIGRYLKYPLLWSLDRWRASTERWMKAKIRSDRERDERRVTEHNINIVSRSILRKFAVKPDVARIFAYEIVKNGKLDVARQFGVEQLAKELKEIL